MFADKIKQEEERKRETVVFSPSPLLLLDLGGGCR
jgi:hypothetical protein